MTEIMAIVNLTPDSFYSGSRTSAVDFARRVGKAFEDGASIVDIGACSTRPGASQPDLEEEWARLEGALKMLPQILKNIPGKSASRFPAVSIDTYRSEIVRRAYEHIGPFIVNDVQAGLQDKGMLPLVSELGLPYVAMFCNALTHSEDGAADPEPIEQVIRFYEDYPLNGKMILDPGFGGFAGKSVEENYRIFESMPDLKKRFPDNPLLVGVSRKSMIYIPAGKTPETCLNETIALEKRAIDLGADILRVHDVAEIVREII